VNGLARLDAEQLGRVPEDPRVRLLEADDCRVDDGVQPPRQIEVLEEPGDRAIRVRDHG
jgi:hypothetical protein